VTFPELETWRWMLGAACALMIGVAKTGAPGLAMLTVPLMVFTVGDARMAAAWTAPMLIVGDVFAVAYWRRQADVRVLLSLAPWVAAGMLLGGAALRLDDAVVRRVLAAIILIMVGLTVASRRRPTTGPTTGRHASAYGVAAGFATTLANAAGPVMSAYLLLKRMPKEQLVATGAWFYLTVNIAKLPIYAANGLLSADSFAFDLCMAPLVAVGAIGGFGLLRRIPQRAFDVLTLGLAAASALALFR
jgi:uncharacterized membrane protein YfcA